MGNTQTHSTTQFQNDGIVKTSEIDSKLPDAYTKQSEPVTEQSIAKFLAKPRVLRASTFTVLDSMAGTPNIYHPHDVLNENLYLSKVEGFLGFRATLVLTLQVNASKFQQGRYMLSYVPMGGARISGTPNALPGDTWLAQHIAFLVQRTQLPHVDFDINCDTEVVLRIPYSSALDYFPLSSLGDVNRYGCQGVIKIFPYSVLDTSSGLTSCGYTLWGHFEDVEMIGAATAQSGISTSRKSKKSFSAVEQTSQNIGPITSASLKVSKASSYLYPIPFIGDYARGVTWISDIIGNVASVFGWSKPNNAAPAMRVRKELGLYASNFDAADNSLPLSLSLKAEVAHDSMSGFSKYDELDIVNFVSTPAYFRSIVFSDIRSTGYLLDSWEVSPVTDVQTHIITGLVTYSYTPCQYIASNFGFWRGSMVYKFKMVKTDFHSGRIAVCFSPEDQRTSYPTMTYDSSDFVYREIVDIREKNEFTIVVPYISSRPYKQCNTFDISYGRIFVYVVDDLVAPDTVPQSITFLVEQSMTSDAEFFCPRWRPRLNTTAVVEAQMNTSSCELTNTVIGGLQDPKFQLTTSQYSVGERLLNLRSFLKRFYQNSTIAPVPATQAGIYHNFLPFAWPMFTVDQTGNTIDIASDFYSQLCCMFTYSRGGVRLKFVNTDSSPGGITTFMEPLTVNDDEVESPHVVGTNTNNNNDYSGIKSNGILSYTLSHPDNSKVTEIEVPMYSTTRMRCNIDHVASRLVPYNVATGSLSTMISVSCTQTQASLAVERTAVTGVFTRAGSDDADFGGFVSIPPMIPF